MRLIEQLRWWAAECDRTNFGCLARKLLLEAAEALEKAEPVKHGRWIWDDNNDRYVCSECNKEPSGNCDGGCVSHLSDYCPNCGAKMDGGDAV